MSRCFCEGTSYVLGLILNCIILDQNYKGMKKIIVVAVIIAMLVTSGIIYWRYFFVFGEGVKGGTLNYFEKKGYIFKTWEGRMVQEGFQSPTSGALQSNEFRFSAKGDDVASKLERAGGKFVELRYREYLNPLPWRGVSNYVVYEVLNVEERRSDIEKPIN